MFFYKKQMLTVIVVLLMLSFALLLITACDPDPENTEPTVALPALSVVEETPTDDAGISSTRTPSAADQNAQVQPSPTYTLQPTISNCTPRTEWQQYTVQSGDSLSRIAQLTGSSVNELTQANCLANASLIQTGQRLYVPNLPPTSDPGVPTRTPLPPPEFVSFTASTQNAAPGQQIIVSWEVKNAPNGVLMRRETWGNGSGTATAPEDFATLPATGSLTFTANSQGFRERYILIVYGDFNGGRFDQTLDVQVSGAPEPEIISFTANVQTTKPGGIVYLSWNVQNADTIHIFYYGSELDHNQQGFVPDYDAPNLAANGTITITLPDPYNHPGVKFVIGANSNSAHRESLITIPFE